MPSTSSPPDLVYARILRHGDDLPERIAIICPDARGGWARLSYRELASRIRRVAGALARRGVGRGDRVVLLVPMSAELYVALLALASLGATAVFVEPAVGPREMARAIRTTAPSAFIGIPKAHALRLFDVTAIPLSVVVGGPAIAARLLGAVTLATLQAEDGAPPPISIAAGDPALLTFSSGSTGVPKGAVRSHGFLGAQHEAIAQVLDVGGRPSGEPDVHMSAFSIVLLSTLVSGHTAVIPRIGRGVDDVDGAALAASVRELGVTVISGSPAFIAPLLSAAGAGGLPAVRRIISGGAPVPVELCEEAGRVLAPDATFLVVYGSTEAEPIARIDAALVRAETAAQTRAGAGLCVGTPDPHLRLQIIAPSTAPIVIGPGGIAALAVPAGEVGEVTVAGAHVNKRYFRDKAAERATKIVDEAGEIWHRTGDAAYLDAAGRLWLVGRVADIVRRDGARYHPSAVEAMARKVPWVARAALIGDAGGTLLVVEPCDGARPGRAERDQLTRALAAGGVAIDRVELVRKLPVDPRHRAKIDYPAVRRQFAARPDPHPENRP